MLFVSFTVQKLLVWSNPICLIFPFTAAKIFLTKYKKALIKKERIKLDFKVKKSYSPKDPSKSMKKLAPNLEKTSTKYLSNKGLIPTIYEECLMINKKKKITPLKRALHSQMMPRCQEQRRTIQSSASGFTLKKKASS